MPNDSVQHQVAVALPQDKAFQFFVGSFRAWWPPEYTWSRERLGSIEIEPKTGGRCIERRDDGIERVWGHVQAFDPPHHLILHWQITPDSQPEPDLAKASTVAVRFVPVDASHTRIELEHRDFDRHGEGWQTYLANMASPYGWPFVLQRYVDALA